MILFRIGYVSRESSYAFVVSLDNTPSANIIMTFDTHVYRIAVPQRYR
jgi:hypothetical protein